MRKVLVALMALGFLVSLGSGAHAFSCPTDFVAAEAAIAKAKTAMNAMPAGDKKGLVHTLIDDANMLLHSARHNHEKPAAGAYDHARAVAKARAASDYADAAVILASK